MNPFKRIIPQILPEYQLIDSGGFEKLEKFGKYVLRRPEPQALWKKSMSDSEWENMADASFIRKKGDQIDGENGLWQLKKHMPERWWVKFEFEDLKFNMRLGLTSFKHVGIFPEQAENWIYIFQKIQSLPIQNPKVLNLFAYTGGASLAARAAGAETTHVDSVKQVITWSRENMEESGLNHIKWVVEDAFKFVQREQRRGNSYHGIILDPPAYGRGPSGEKWYLEKHIDEFLFYCSQILEPENAFLVANFYSMGFSPVITETLIEQHFPNQNYVSGELILKDLYKKHLPLGTLLRLER